MELKIFILSLAVFSCAVQPVLGSLLLLKAAAAAGAVKGAALLGAGALAVKGAAIKGAVKVAAAKGAAILAAKAAAVKGAVALAAEAASLVHKPPPVQSVIIEKPVIVDYSLPAIVPANTVSVQTSPPHPPSILNSLIALWSAAHEAAEHKAEAVSDALEVLHQPRPAFVAPVVYEYAPHFYPAPLPILERIDDDCL